MTVAVLAGTGALPEAVLEATGGWLVRFAGAGCDARSERVIDARFEQFGKLFSDLRDAGVTTLVFAGAMQRPALDPMLLDPDTLALMPRVLPALQAGDDTLLREIVAIFEEEGFSVVGAPSLVPGLVATAGPLVGTPSGQDLSDAARGGAILTALGPQDVGQGCVVAEGLCLGIETIQGTDAMLGFVARTRAGFGTGGVFVKRPKPGQDLRVDMPVIGPETIAAAAKAGLSAIQIAAGTVMILRRAETLAQAEAAGIVIWAE